MKLFIVIELGEDEEWLDSVWSSSKAAEERIAKLKRESPKLKTFYTQTLILDNPPVYVKGRAV